MKARNYVSKKLIQDLRIYESYSMPRSLFYLYNYLEIVLNILRKRDFKLPGFTHVYISVGESRNEAASNALNIESWFKYCVAVLKKKKLINASEIEKERLMLKVIKDGLMDLANLFHLDKKVIHETITDAKKIGLSSERILEKAENMSWSFLITYFIIKGKTDINIYFTLKNNKTGQIIKWKFGRINQVTAEAWLYRAKLSMKGVIITPQPYSQLYLSEKRLKLKIQLPFSRIMNKKSSHYTLKKFRRPTHVY